MPAAQKNGTNAGGKGEPGHHEPKKKLACEECYRKKVKCSQEKPMCLKCRENGTYCTYLPSQRRGKGKAGPRPATASHQVPYQVTNDPSYFENVNDHFWLQPHELESDQDIAAYAAGNRAAMPAASMHSDPTSATSSMACSPLIGRQQMSFEQDHIADAPLYDGYQYPTHSRSNSYDMTAMMSRTNSFQASRDVQQTYALNLTPLSTPPSMGKSSPVPVATTQSHRGQMVAHAAASHIGASVPAGRPYDTQNFSAAVAGSQGRETCDCFDSCQQCLNALRKTDVSNVAKVMKLCGMAMQACLCLLRCLPCRNSISADTVSLVASIIDKVACLYGHIFSSLDRDLARSEANHGSSVDFAQPTQRAHVRRLFTQRVATLRDVHHRYIEMCGSLPEVYAIALAWVDRINDQMGWTDGLTSSQTQTMHGGNFTNQDIPDFGLNFI